MVDVAEIERRVDRAIAAPIQVNADIGGIALENMGQVMEFAKLMSVSGSAVPKYLRGNPGGCLAICSRALRWQMDPFAVAEKSYQVTNKGEERIAFEAQLVHAVITARAPLKTRLRHEIVGEGNERRCRVWGTFRGEDKAHEYTSETLGKMLASRPKRREGEGFGGSPLWDTQPEVQLAYSTYRQWCRLFASETLLGVYTPDELDDGSEPVDVTPQISKVGALAQRLRDATAKNAPVSRGLDLGHVERATNTVIEGSVNPDGAKQEEEGRADDNSDKQGRRTGSEDRRERADDQGAGGEGDRGPAQVAEASAGPSAAKVEGEGEVAENGKPAPKGRKGKR